MEKSAKNGLKSLKKGQKIDSVNYNSLQFLRI